LVSTVKGISLGGRGMQPNSGAALDQVPLDKLQGQLNERLSLEVAEVESGLPMQAPTKACRVRAPLAGPLPGIWCQLRCHLHRVGSILRA